MLNHCIQQGLIVFTRIISVATFKSREFDQVSPILYFTMGQGLGRHSHLAQGTFRRVRLVSAASSPLADVDLVFPLMDFPSEYRSRCS